MSSPAASTNPTRNLLRRFRRNRRASAAVEFALVAPMFFALLFGIIETAIIFAAGQLLETVAQGSARSVLTGQTATAGYVASDFKTLVVCPLIPALFSCANVSVDVQSYSSFANVVITSQIDASKHFINNMQYNPGKACDIVVVRLFYQWPQFVTGLGYDISNLTGSKRLLYGTAAFRNEPWPSPLPSDCPAS